jgi:hypothetical protein
MGLSTDQTNEKTKTEKKNSKLIYKKSNMTKKRSTTNECIKAARLKLTRNKALKSSHSKA